MALIHNASKLKLLTKQRNTGNRRNKPPYKQDGTDVRPSDIDNIVEAIYEDLSLLSSGGDGNGIFSASNDDVNVPTAFNMGLTNTLTVADTLFTFDDTNKRVGVGTADVFNSCPVYGGDSSYAPIFTLRTADDKYGFNHNNGVTSLSSYLGGGSAFFGTTSNSVLNLMVNDTSVITFNGTQVTIPSGNIVAGGGDFRTSNLDGFIVQDRSSISDYYRIKVDNGVLGIELV